MLKFTPSSTQELNLSSLRIALISYITAKQKDDELIFVVDDNEEIKEPLDSQNIEILKKFAIEAKDTIYKSKNKNIYQSLALKLLEEQKAFVCFCSNQTDDNCNLECFNLTQDEISKLKDSKKEFKIRVKEPTSNIVIQDIINKDIEVDKKNIGTFAILESLEGNNKATTLFTDAIDIMLLAITCQIRDKSDINLSAKELYILNLLDYSQIPNYAHLPSLEGADEITIKSLFKQGFLPDTIINYLLSPLVDIDKKVFYLPEAIKKFSLENISKDAIKFNMQELKELNRKHLMLIDDKKLSTIFGFADSNIGKLAKLFLKDAYTINELITALKAVFSQKECSDEIKEVAKVIQNAPMISDFNKFKAYIKDNIKIDDKRLETALRVLLVGSKESNVELKEVFKLINPYLHKPIFTGGSKMSIVINPLIGTLIMILNIYSFIVIISALLSFVRPDPNNQFVQVIYKLTEPVFSYLRRKFPFLVYSGIDFSPLVVILAINFLISVLTNLYI